MVQQGCIRALLWSKQLLLFTTLAVMHIVWGIQSDIYNLIYTNSTIERQLVLSSVRMVMLVLFVL